MAPTKPASQDPKLTPTQSADLLLAYLRKQNRPYSTTDISANLKNRVTKAAAAKLLKDLHERGELEARASGKQIVYHAVQDEADESSLEALQAMDAETARLKDATAALKVAEKELRAQLRECAEVTPVSELKGAVAALESEKEALGEPLAKLRAGNVKPVSAEERARVNAELAKWQKAAGARRSIRAEMWRTIEEFIADKERAAETKERLGLEGVM
ncbi:hypothetical protein WHR41_09093 [Cladosporium halotolerans]|uniref:Homologous-pairing protein 2 winged helix domain-containing protein n=1 Tax=Cladosporium halotolerans TaxID=1052096 RepID=A0AB34KAZ4_9PEZI